MKLRLAWVAVLALIFGTNVVGASAAATRTGSISGLVRDSSGVPQMGAAVEILGAAPTPALLLYTDRNGRFAAKNLLPGRYQVKATEASFLPTLRQDLSLRAGSELVVNLTLNTLFEALQIMPVRARTVDDQDDWKWTLRSMANRPILRIMDGSPLVVVSSPSGNGEDRTLKARVEFVAGSPGNSIGSSDGQATAFAVESSIFSSDKLQFNGHVGSALSSPAVMRLAYSHQFADGARPEIAVTARRFFIQAPGNDHAALDAYGVSVSNQTRIADFADLEYGSEYQTIQFLGREAAFRPHATLDLHLSPDTVVEYRYATTRPNTRMEKGFDSAPADLSESGPRMSMVGFDPRLESAHHQEVSISERVGANSFQLAGFVDRINNLALLGTGDDLVDDNSGTLLADPYSQTFTFFGGNLSTGGMRAVAEHKFSEALKSTVDVAYGGALAVAHPGSTLSQPAEFARLRAASVSTKLAGRIAPTKTSWQASYKWSSAPNALTTVDAFNASAGEADPYFNIFIRQPLPAPGFVPGKMEALVDIRNLLAQGYIPVLGQDGHTLYLVQSARSIRGGLAFNF